MSQTIAANRPGLFYRRLIQIDYNSGLHPGPGNPGARAELVDAERKTELAPDRERVDIGSDNNYEYNSTLF